MLVHLANLPRLADPYPPAAPAVVWKTSFQADSRAVSPRCHDRRPAPHDA